MVTFQYIYKGEIESYRVSLGNAIEYAKALEVKGVACQIISD